MKRFVVIDTNCLVQMLSVHSSYRPAWQAFREGKYELCVTNEILEEYQEILERVANEAVAYNVVMRLYVVHLHAFILPIFVSALLSKILMIINLWIVPLLQEQII